MSDKLTAAILWLMILAPIGIFVRQLRLVRAGTVSKVKGATLFFVYSLLPMVVCVLGFAALIGLEEFMDVPVISEGVARALLPGVAIAFALAVALNCLFGISVYFLRAIKRTD